MRKLTKAQISEVKDLYVGDYSSVRELARIFEVTEIVIRWAVDHKGFRKKHNEYVKDWKKRNPEKCKEMRLRAQKKYKKLHREIILKRSKEYYRKNREKYIEYQKEYYKKNRERILKRNKEYRKNHKK